MSASLVLRFLAFGEKMNNGKEDLADLDFEPYKNSGMNWKDSFSFLNSIAIYVYCLRVSSSGPLVQWRSCETAR